MYNPDMEENSPDKMPIAQHLEDLRKVLLRALLGLMAGVIAGAFSSNLCLISLPNLSEGWTIYR